VARHGQANRRSKAMLSVQQLATRWHRSERTIYRWIHDGFVPAYDIGGLRIDLEDIEAIEAGLRLR
jgi:excisionase family DNA binding protein